MNKERLEEMLADAVEEETAPGRHRKEEAVLATVAAVGLDDSDLWSGFDALAWSRSDFAAIAEGVRACTEEGIALHPDTVRERLPKGAPEVEVGVLSRILDGSKAVDVTVARDYIRTLAVQDKRRRLADLGRELQERAFNEDLDVDAATGDLLKTVCDLVTSKNLVAAYPTEAEDAKGFVDVLAERRNDDRAWLGLDSGFKHLNEVLNGLTEGVFILAGAPSCGKTTLAKQIADNVAATEQVPVLFWSFEQSREELRIKSLARLASVDSRAIWKGRTAKEETWKQVWDAGNDYLLKQGPHLTVIEAGRDDTLDRIRTAALLAKNKAGRDKPVLLVIDYLQIIPAGDAARDTIRERIDWHLSELRRLARDLKSPVLVVSSENREAYKGNNKPTLTALKESGGIEYSADAVICLHRDKEESEVLTKKFGRLTWRVEAYVLKNRNGELAKVELDFTPAWATFGEQGIQDLTWSDALGE